MKLPALMTADTHLTDSTRDAYRWNLFPWLADQSRIEGVKTVVIHGDLTDRKDNHSATLTNRVVQNICKLREVVDEIIINMGNHDYLKEGHAYFAFLSAIPGVTFITKSTEVMMDTGPGALFLPHTRDPAKAWAGSDFSHYDYLFIHQTIKGAKSSNGQEMEGEPMPDLSAAGKVYSGDIHVPQKIGPIEYIGSPYHVHFGDRFKPRCVLLDRRNRAVDLHFETISRMAIQVSSVADLRKLQLKPGDQVKVTVDLSEAEAHEWAARRRSITEHLGRADVEVHGIELRVDRSQRAIRRVGGGSAPAPKINASDAVLDFVRANGLGAEAADLGLEALK